MRTGAALALGAALLCACGSGTSTEEATGTRAGQEADCAAVTRVPAPRALEERVDLADLVTWTTVSSDDSSVNAVGVAEEATVAPVLSAVRRSLADQGWTAFSLDDEGFEAEVLARDAEDVLLALTLRQGACPSRIDVMLSITDYAALE